MRPARAPPSIDMLQMVIRPSIDNASMVSPRYSRTWPVPPLTPMRLMMARMMSLAVDQAGSSPVTLTAIACGRLWGRVWVASTCSTSEVPIPNASAPKAPWVEVWLSPHTMVMPGWVMPCSGPMMWTMPWRGSSRPYRVIPCCFAVGDERLDLLAGERVTDAVLAADGGNPVVDGGEGEVGPAHRTARQAETLEGLRRGHLMDEVKVDVQEIRLAGGAPDDVIGPDFLEQGTWHRRYGSRERTPIRPLTSNACSSWSCWLRSRSPRRSARPLLPQQTTRTATSASRWRSRSTPDLWPITWWSMC